MPKVRMMAVLLILALTGCGPIIGAGMVAGGGVKDFSVNQGQLQELFPGSQLLVVGPFAKTEQAYYICRGEEAANFTTELNAAGLFQADLFMTERFSQNRDLIAGLKHKTQVELQRELKLTAPPELLLSGTILHRSTVAAPTKGVLMEVGYRLEFYNLNTRKTTVVEIEIKDLFQDCIADAVSELVARLSSN